jgi:hypothetical protein
MTGTSRHAIRLAAAVREDDLRRAAQRRPTMTAPDEPGTRTSAATTTPPATSAWRGPSWRGAIGRIFAQHV